MVSIGQRCREMGYSFHWLPYSSEPYFEASDGTIIPLVVYGNVPYLERLKVADPAVPAERGEEDAASPQGSQPTGRHPQEGSHMGEQPNVGDGDEWLKPFGPDDVSDEARQGEWVEVDTGGESDLEWDDGEIPGMPLTKAEKLKQEAESCITCSITFQRTPIAAHADWRRPSGDPR